MPETERPLFGAEDLRLIQKANEAIERNTRRGQRSEAPLLDIAETHDVVKPQTKEAK